MTQENELARQRHVQAGLDAALAVFEHGGLAFQARVQPWMMACFGTEVSGDREERKHRFLEEALELVQSCGCTASEAHQLVDYTFARDVGEPSQETGGVMVTFAALCLANGLDMHGAGEVELARIWTKVEQIRAKQAAKPKHSPLPVHRSSEPSAARDDAGETEATPAHLHNDADAYRGDQLKQADGHIGGMPYWHGSALFDAYVAGATKSRLALRSKRGSTLLPQPADARVEELKAALISLRNRFYRACVASGSDPGYAEAACSDADAAIALANESRP